MIDFTFIEQLEGNTCQGYVPDLQHSHSGVTIGCGFDLGQRSELEIKQAFSLELARKLLPYTELIRHGALHALKQLPLTITQDQVIEINEYCKKSALIKLQKQWQQSSSIFAFDELANECQTVIASVAFQYGNLARRTPIFWRQVTAAKWFDALSNLRDFGDHYTSRRNKEADLLASWLKDK